MPDVLDLTAPTESIRMSDFYEPWPHQRAFHTMRAKNRLQIGSFGSGKSKPLLMEAVRYCLHFPGINAIILRKTIPDLKRTVIDKFEADVPKSAYEKGSQEKGTFNKSDHIVYWPPVEVPERDPETLQPLLDEFGDQRMVWRQSKLYFGACETEKDVGKFLSTEFAFVGFEELGEFPYIIFDAMSNRNRCTIPGVRSTLGAATNPMGVGWSWLKKLFIDKKPCAGMDAALYDPRDYGFVHSTIDQNPLLFRDKEYVKSLEKSPLRDKIRWGKLDSTTGQYYDNWDETRHVRPASDFLFEPWQPCWIGWDYGFGHYAAITFFTKATLKPRFESDRSKVVNVCYREIILEQNSPEEQTAALIASIPRDDNGGYLEQIESIHFSWERFNRTVSNRTVADEVTALLSSAGLPPVQRSNNDRIAGWTKIYSMLDADDFFILQSDGLHRGAPQLAEAIPLLVRGDGITHDLEDVIKPKGVSLIDDLGDSMRYGVAGVLLDPEDKPKHVLLREKIESIKDPMAKHIFAYKEWLKENKKSNGPAKPPMIPSWVNKVRPQRQS